MSIAIVPPSRLTKEKWEYVVLAVGNSGVESINKLYSEGWEFVDSVSANNLVYFTIRIKRIEVINQNGNK